MWVKQRWPAGVWDVRTQHSPESGPSVGPGEGHHDVYTAMIGAPPPRRPAAPPPRRLAALPTDTVGVCG